LTLSLFKLNFWKLVIPIGDEFDDGGCEFDDDGSEFNGDSEFDDGGCEFDGGSEFNGDSEFNGGTIGIFGKLDKQIVR